MGGCSNAWVPFETRRPKEGDNAAIGRRRNSPLVTSVQRFARKVIAAPQSGFESDSDRASAQPQGKFSKKRNVKAKPSVQAKSLLYVHREPFDHEEDDVWHRGLATRQSEPLSPDDPARPAAL